MEKQNQPRPFIKHKVTVAISACDSSLLNGGPSARASLQEGLEETLTVHRLKVPGLLRQTLSNTNTIESANSVAASIVRRVSKWRDGEMVLRHMAAGFLEAERGFRRVRGYRQLPFLEASLYAATGAILDNMADTMAI